MRKIVKMILSSVMALIMLVEILPYTTLPVQAASVQVNTKEALSAALSGSEEAEVKLTADISTDSTLVIAGTKTLDLNGYGIRMTGEGSVIQIGDSSAATLTITDSRPTSVHYITLTGYRGTNVADSGVESAVNDTGDGIIKVNGGYITGGNVQANNYYSSARCGGGIFIKNGVMNYDSGSTVGNYAGLGGGIFIDRNSTVNMSGTATVCYNSAVFGGSGIYIHSISPNEMGDLIMSGGRIIHNRVIIGSSNETQNFGGGVYASGNFTMTGGIISENRAWNGGGVHVSTGKRLSSSVGNFRMSGGTIKENIAGAIGGGVSIENSSVFDLSGGAIKNNADYNSSDFHGGGIYFVGGTFYLSGCPDISGNFHSPNGTGSIQNSNIVISYSHINYINIKDALTNTELYGVSKITYNSNTLMYMGDVFTSHWSDYNNDADPTDHFISEIDGYIIAKSDEGELKFVSGVYYKALNDSTKPVITNTTDADRTVPVPGDVLKAKSLASHLTYQWYSDGVMISGATESTYTVQTEDIGKTISVTVTQPQNSDGDGMPAADVTMTSTPTSAVGKPAPEALDQGTAEESITIDYANETVTPLAGFDVSINGSSVDTSPVSLTGVLNQNDDPKVYVRRAETDTTSAGDWVAITLTARPGAPSDITTEKASSGATEDGRISNVDSNMEYSRSGETTWTSVLANPVYVLPGTYLVRYKATSGAPHSASTEVTVGVEHTPLTEDNKPVITVSNDHNPPIIGDTLTAETTATDVIYEWYRDDTVIEGAESSTYLLTSDDSGKSIKVKVIQTKKSDGTDYAENERPIQTSVATAAVNKKTPATVDGDTAKSNITISYSGEQVTPQTGYEVSTDNSTVAAAPVSLTTIFDGDGTPTIYVRTAETDDTAAGGWVAITLNARPDAPTAPETANATNGTTANGKIKNALSTWEYKNKETGKEPVSWTAMTVGDMTVKAGTYLIRVKATNDTPAGRTTEVIVGSNYTALNEATKPTVSVSGDHNPPMIGDTLTASTAATGVIYQWYRGDEPISGATSSTYTLTADDAGKPVKVVITQTKDENGNDYTENAPTQESGATARVVKITPAAIDTNTAKDNITINYINESLTPKNGYEISTDGVNPAASSPVSLTDVLDGENTPKIYVRTAETDDTAAGGWVAITLNARPDAPTELGSTNATDGASEDGTITGVSETMEYSADGTNWTPVNGTTITGLKAGTYKVRVRATANAPHGKAAEVTVGSREIILTDSQKPTAKNNLIYNGSEQSLLNEPVAALPEGATGLQYAIGTDASTAPTSGWGTSIPKKTEVGTYYVWYKVKGDENHNDTDPVCLPVTIAKCSAPTVLTDDQKPAPNTELIYSSEPKELVNKPTKLPEGYTGVQYRLSDEDGWSDKLPTGMSADTYTVQVKYVGDSNHEDFIGDPIKVTIAKANVTVTANAASKTYGKEDPTLDATVKGLIGSDKVTYTLARAEGESAGTYVITPSGEAAQGNYTVDYQTGTFTIEAKTTDNEDITAKQKEDETLTYTGNPVKPSIVITDGTDDNKKELVEGKDYTVTYVGVEPTVYPGEGGDGTKAPTNAGKYKAVITFKDNYTGTKEVEFTIAKSGQEAPDSGTFTTTNADDAENINGKIDGFDKEKTYQYSSDDGKTWTDVPKGATSIDVKVGTYKIRFAGDDNHEPSEAVKVTVGIASRTQGVVNFNKDEASGSEAYVETVVEEAKSSNIETFAESQVEEGKDVKVELEITPKKEDDVDKASVTEIGGTVDEVFAGIETESIVTEYLQIDLAKYVDNAKEGNISDTKSPLEIELTYDETKAGNPIVVRTHNGKAKAFGKLNERPKTDFKDATYHAANGKIYLYSQYFSDFAIVYSTKKTYYVNVDLGNGETLSQVVGENSKLDLPTGLTKEGFAFGGWYKDAEYNNAWDVDKDTVSGDISIYGKWNKSVTGVKVDVDNVTFTKAGESTKLNVSVIPSDAADKKVTFASSDPKVVTVDENGNITAVANGTATITVTTEDGAKIATVKVTVAIPDVDKQGTTDQQTVEPTKEEKAAISMNAGLKISQTGSKINIKWGKVKEADGYDLYVTYCGESFAHKKPAKTFDKNTTVKANITKINGKKINLKKNFKLYVAAYKMVEGKKEILAKTITGHVVGRKNTKYSNAKNIKITSKTKVSIRQGKTSKIKAKTILVSKGKKQLSDTHAKEFRYASSNNSIATVDKNGKIKGIAKGTCTIYVYSRNGYAKKVSVTVK